MSGASDHGSYTCAGCGGVFEKTRPDSEALAEAGDMWGDQLGDDPAVVCDDCWRKMMGDLQ